MSKKLLEAQTVKCNLSSRYYRATFSMRNGVKWLSGDIIKVGETSLVMGVALMSEKGLTVRKGERCSEIQPYVTA